MDVRRRRRALAAIADYNDDDVPATKALRDWLITLRPNDMEWPTIEVSESDEEEFAELIARLDAQPAIRLDLFLLACSATGVEGSAHYADHPAWKATSVIASTATIAGLFDHEQFERAGKSGNRSASACAFLIRRSVVDSPLSNSRSSRSSTRRRKPAYRFEGVDRDENIVGRVEGSGVAPSP